MNILSFNPANDSERFFDLLKELRPHLSFSEFKFILNHADNYQMVALEEDNRLVALMGYRILHDFVHGKHVYIDDLVTASAERSKGHGAVLLKHAEDIAREHGCKNLRLCTGVENEAGKRFYERESWNMRAVVYKKKI
jgi:ribosomal protein S18 acetylase RimI-like enzyme